ncbi:MAG: hypothetical protein LBE16_02890 [Clostridiales Family XIII bacterium]|jgi:hypothetical protein|nr:hypothetical protein [Clostridiales Family XIII bacterium]
MDEIFINFLLPDLYNAALAQLKAVCRFDPAEDSHARMLEDALAAHRGWTKGATLAAVATCFAPLAPKGPVLRLAGVAFSCPAFAQTDADNLIRAYAYALSLHADEGPDRRLSHLFYRDLWQTAYLDTARAALRARLAAGTDGVLSDSFGPGYYGMDIGEMKKLARVLDFGRIGATVLDDGSIRPPKSCAGIFFAVRDAARMPRGACRSCAGERGGCDFCAHGRLSGFD